ncbi:MAG: acyl-CoA thioesterase [Candidatus Lambdaproteobacteria bacterium]|nr:acyl-CoA thioesterase [Candidatus Lambdaproteobacteria bacterium]
MAKVYAFDFQVRDYELDQYGVVNNAVYLNYLEHTRHEFLIGLGIDPAAVARSGMALALSAIEVRFRAPLRSREPFRVYLSIAAIAGVRVTIRQRMVALPAESPVLDALAVAVFLDERHRPVRLPSEHRRRFAEYLEAAGQG